MLKLALKPQLSVTELQNRTAVCAITDQIAEVDEAKEDIIILILYFLKPGTH